MPYPTNVEIFSIFGELSKVPFGYLAFFDHVDDDVKWEITGQNALSGVWESKSEFMNTVWLPIIQLFGEPGPALEVVSPESIMTNADGWVAIELKTTDTRTKLGNRLYNQHYCWHCKFNTAKKLVHVRAFIDSSTAEIILLEERLRQESVKTIPNYGKDMLTLDLNYPMVPFDAAFKRFLGRFYLLTDAPNENENYVQCFTPGALVLIGSKAVRGRAEIRLLRSSMWGRIKQRTHRPKQVFPYGANASTAMVYGTVDYVFEDNSTKTVDWAAKCDFVKLDQVYLDRYQVYLADDVAWKSEANQ